MKLESHYIRLRERLPSPSEQQPIETTIGDIAAALDCTHRNAVIVLGKMTALGWLGWNPARGRGNKSTLTFLVKTDEMIIRLAQQLVQKKDLRGALEQMNVSSVPTSLKDHFHSWLNGQFGHTSELHNDKRIDILRFPSTSPIGTLDPLLMNFSAESHIVNQLFDSLVRHNRQRQTIEPHLAHHWETDDSRTVWTFYLRKGVLFHHGRELTADDVVFSLLRLKQTNKRLLYRWAYSRMRAVEAVDPITVRIELSEPNELFLPFLCTNRVSIVPRDICADLNGQFGEAPIGTGPFRLSRHDGSMSVLEAFPAYFQGRAHLDRVELWHIPDLHTEERTEPLHTFQIIQNYRLPGEPSGDWIQQKHGATCKFVTFNMMKQGPLLDDGIRAAVFAALHPNRIVQEAAVSTDPRFSQQSGAFVATTGFVQTEQPYSGAGTHREGSPRGAVRAEAGQTGGTGAAADAVALADNSGSDARRRLRDAGYRGETIRLCTIAQYEHDARLIQRIAGQAGIKLEVMLLTAEEFKSERRLQADMLLFSLILDADVELRLIDLYRSMQNHMQPEPRAWMERSIAGLLAEPERSRRTELFMNIETGLAERHLLAVLYRKQLTTIYHSSVNGVSLDSLDWVEFKNIWFKP